jgi:hypothetical protein
VVPLLPACAGACVLVLALAIEKTQEQEWLGSDSCLLDQLSDRGSPLPALTNSVFLRVSAACDSTVSISSSRPVKRVKNQDWDLRRTH